MLRIVLPSDLRHISIKFESCLHAINMFPLFLKYDSVKFEWCVDHACIVLVQTCGAVAHAQDRALANNLFCLTDLGKEFVGCKTLCFGEATSCSPFRFRLGWTELFCQARVSEQICTLQCTVDSGIARSRGVGLPRLYFRKFWTVYMVGARWRTFHVRVVGCKRLCFTIVARNRTTHGISSVLGSFCRFGKQNWTLPQCLVQCFQYYAYLFCGSTVHLAPIVHLTPMAHLTPTNHVTPMIHVTPMACLTPMVCLMMPMVHLAPVVHLTPLVHRTPMVHVVLCFYAWYFVLQPCCVEFAGCSLVCLFVVRLLDASAIAIMSATTSS